MVLSHRAETISTEEGFQRFREAAVFAAFKAVEETVRRTGNFGPTDIGVPLMRKAFDKTTGPLSDPNQPEPEREDTNENPEQTGLTGLTGFKGEPETKNLKDSAGLKKQSY